MSSFKHAILAIHISKDDQGLINGLFDKVLQGDLLGLCCNSGNSSEPHLHFHIQTVDDMYVATGAKCFFDPIMVNGEIKSDYSPIKSEIIP